MTRIEVPAWARRPDVDVARVRPDAYRAIQQHRESMLDVVHREVEDYLNTPGLYGEGDPAMFPDRSRMTGEYYVGDEFYDVEPGQASVRISVACRCLERPTRRGQEDRDYLGLEVWLSYEPVAGSFTVCRNTNSSSI